jgi:Zn-dependent metalloprotease
MFPNKNQTLFRRNDSDNTVARLPKRPYVAAIGQLLQNDATIEVDYDHFGDVRHLTTSSPQGLLTAKYNGNPLAHARKLLKDSVIARAFGLSTVEIASGGVDDVPNLGHRVWFQQVLTIRGVKKPVTVRGGFLHVFIDKSGRVFMINSTLRRGRKPSSLKGIVSEAAAIAAATKAHGVATCEKAEVTLTLSAHKGRIDPVYEVVLHSCEPRKIVQYLVKATTGTVVYQESKLHYAGTPARTLLQEPDPKVAIANQVRDYSIEGLPDPLVLENRRFSMKVRKNGKWVTARAKEDGTFNYNPGDPEFSAVVCFVAMNEQAELCEALGMTTNYKQIPVFCDDPDVSDNAYFDPENWEIHMGVGSGRGGLTKYIAFSIMVELHEMGHEIVAIVTPGKDLPGAEGGATHEATGDFFALLTNYVLQTKYGKLTKQAVSADPRYIGPYSLPPTGIRTQKNTKRTPRDKTGEVHDDGLIIGGALADMLCSMATNDAVQLLDGLNTAGKLYLTALSLVPAHKVLFKDVLRALVTADQTLNGGANKALITKSFADHGISLGAGVETPIATGRRPRSRKRKAC